MNIIVTSLNIFWMREYEKAKAISYDYDKKRVHITDENGNDYSYASDQVMISITFSE